MNGLPGLLCTISAGEGSVHTGTEDPRLKESESIVRFSEFDSDLLLL